MRSHKSLSCAPYRKHSLPVVLAQDKHGHGRVGLPGTES